VVAQPAHADIRVFIGNPSACALPSEFLGLAIGFGEHQHGAFARLASKRHVWVPPNKSVNPTFISLRFIHAGYLQRRAACLFVKHLGAVARSPKGPGATLPHDHRP
jgi:hypothetical protein